MLHFALIGCGRIAVRHAENIIRVGKLVAVCDVVMDKALSFATKYDSVAYTSLDELLEKETEVTIVCICTPNGFHAEHSIKSLQAGKHVLCEKPMCLTVDEANSIMDVEKLSGKRLFIVKSMRFNPLLRSIKDMISNGKLGNIYSFQLSCFWNRSHEYFNGWHGKKFPDGGTLFTQFSHYIDAILWLFGSLENAKGYTTNVAHKNVIEFEDTGVVSLQFEKGILGSLNWSINTYLKNFEIALTVIAEKGTIAIDGEFLNKVKYQNLETEINLSVLENITDRSALSYHSEVYNNLSASIKDEQHAFSNSIDGMKTVEAIELIYKSITKN